MAGAEAVPFEWSADATTAFRRAREVAGLNGLVLVAGSHYLVGELMPAAHFDTGTGWKKWGQNLSWTEIRRMSRLPR